MRSSLWLICALLLPAQLTAQDMEGKGTDKVILETPSAIKWGPAPASLPPGAQGAVLEGDPSKPGAFTLRLSMPAGYQIPPHYHPKVEHVTVISGTFMVGMGETFNKTQGTALPAGTFAAVPVGMRHFAWTEVPTVIQLHGVGPWGITYVNSADDPRTKPK